MTEHEKRIREALLIAAINCPHEITDDRITLHFNAAKPGHNALNQLSTRLEEANSALLADLDAVRGALEEARDLLEKKAGERGHGCTYTARECHPTVFARIDAALSAAKDGGWLPIETCPRDFGGTKFDVWANGQRYADCWWGKATYEQGECGVVYQSDYDCNGPVDSYVKGATAWQPLPNPPKGEV